jgi:hypothetical protein
MRKLHGFEGKGKMVMKLWNGRLWKKPTVIYFNFLPQQAESPVEIDVNQKFDSRRAK